MMWFALTKRNNDAKREEFDFGDGDYNCRTCLADLGTALGFEFHEPYFTAAWTGTSVI